MAFASMIETKLLNMLVCPVTKGKLIYDREQQCLVSRQAKLCFPIIDGIPNMLVDTALTLHEVNDKPSVGESNIEGSDKGGGDN